MISTNIGIHNLLEDEFLMILMAQSDVYNQYCQYYPGFVICGQLQMMIWMTPVFLTIMLYMERLGTVYDLDASCSSLIQKITAFKFPIQFWVEKEQENHCITMAFYFEIDSILMLLLLLLLLSSPLLHEFLCCCCCCCCRQ